MLPKYAGHRRPASPWIESPDSPSLSERSDEGRGSEEQPNFVQPPAAKRAKTGAGAAASASGTTSSRPVAAAASSSPVAAVTAAAPSCLPGELFKALSIGLQSQLQSIAIRLGVSSAMALREFERFLELKQFMKDSKPEKLSPTPLMDAVWHAALLETELYDRIEEHIGIRLHHSTAGAATDAVASAERGRRLAVLHQLYHLRYNEHPVEPPAALAFPRAPGHVRLFVKTLGGETTTLDVQPTDTVASVKQCMYITEGIPTAQQNLSFAGKHLEDGRTPASYKITDEATVHLVLDLRGC